MKIEDISPELIEKAEACQTTEELFALAKSEGTELPDEVLEQIAGGDAWGEIRLLWSSCQYCGSDNLEFVEKTNGIRVYQCKSCGKYSRD